MNFSSDNASGCCPEIMAALAEANTGPAMAYGSDALTARAEQALAALFECELEAYPVATGTAANALALSVLTPPWGLVYCHRRAHIEEDECGAPELFSGGAKLHLLDGDDAKFTARTLEAALAEAGPGVEHHPQPARSGPSPRWRIAMASPCTWTGPASPTPWSRAVPARPNSAGGPAST